MSVFDLMMAPSLSLARRRRGGRLSLFLHRSRSVQTHRGVVLPMVLLRLRRGERAQRRK
jgi:hypothetical protein